MILNNHIIPHSELDCKGAKECLLSDADNFSTVDMLPGRNDVDGSYVVYDKKRKQFIRSGASAVGINKLWKEHCAASFLRNHNERANKFTVHILHLMPMFVIVK